MKTEQIIGNLIDLLLKRRIITNEEANKIYEGDPSTPKCKIDGCEEEAEENEDYCLRDLKLIEDARGE